VDEEYKIEINERRDDYTDLSFVYWVKIVALIIVVIVGIVITLYDFKSLLITAFTFFIGVVFDFIVISMKNKGPKIKLRIRIAQVAIFVVTIGIITCIVCMICLLQYGTMDNSARVAIQYYIYAAMASGIISPILELIINQPNDD